MKHCTVTVKHLNNLIKHDYRYIKRRFAKSAGFQNLRHVSPTIPAIYKQKRSHSSDFSFSTYKELQPLLSTA